MNNIDYIQSLTTDQLAKVLCKIRCRLDELNCPGCVAEKYCKYGHTGFVDWLNENAETLEYEVNYE